MEAFKTWRTKSEGKACIDYGLHMAVTDLGPNDAWLDDVDEMVRQGITSFKIFMAYPNVLMVNDATIFKLMQRTQKLGALVCVHAENGTVIDVIVQQALAAGHTGPLYHALTRPVTAEAEAVHRVVALSELAGGANTYIVHVSCEEAMREVEAARRRRLPVMGETCTQYLVLSIEDDMGKPGFEDAKYVFTPPLRKKKNQAQLWSAVKDDVLQVVSTDHCPFRFKDQKTLGLEAFTKIPNGGPGIENRMQLVYHHGVNAGQISLERFVEVTAEAPAKIFGMYPKKGVVAAGSDADILVWDPEAKYTDYVQRPRACTPTTPSAEGFEGGRATRARYSRAASWWWRAASSWGAWAEGSICIAAWARLPADESLRRRPDEPDRRVRTARRPAALQLRSRAHYAGTADLAEQLTNYIALWFSMSMEVTTYMLASSLIAGGMNWKQAIATILLGNLIVLVPMVLNAHAGAKYGIPFPVFVRASFGVKGANIPAMLRALVACGWFGIQSWIGGTAIAQMVNVLAPRTTQMPAVDMILLPRLLGAGTCFFCSVARSGVNPLSAELLGAIHDSDVTTAAWLRVAPRGRLWAAALRAQPVPNDRELSAFLLPCPHRHGGLLGDALAEHPRLHALRKIAGVADRRPGVWFRRWRHDAVLHAGHRVHPRPRRLFSASRSGLRGGAAGAISMSRCWPSSD